jgi:hypothetical protein
MRAACIRGTWGLCALALTLTSPVTTQAAPKKSIGERIAVTGCAYPGPAAACLLLKDADGTVYNISSVSPWPRPIGRMIALRGTITARPSACGQDTVLDRIRWTRLRQKCPS